jgi:hypothetical protein
MEEQEKQHLGPQDRPFDTTDGILAFALYLAGVPFVSQKMWCKNTYTLDTLRRLGYEGIEAREAAKTAVKANLKGKVQYFFQQVEKLSELLEDFTSQEQGMEAAEGESREYLQAICEQYKNGELEFEEFITRATCVWGKIRRDFMDGWKEMTPHVRVMHEGKVERSQFPFVDDKGNQRIGEKVIRPGFAEFPADAPDEMLQKLGVL